ncbi:MAG: HAD family hydrolase [Candidatus Saccharimonadales bacterium]
MVVMQGTVVWNDLCVQDAAGRKRSALITDIDNTLYRAGHDGAVQAAWDLRANATGTPYPIVAVTGADYDQLVRGRLESKELPLLDVLVTSVGTEIRYLMPDGTYEKDTEYGNLLKKTGYNRLIIISRLQTLLPQLRAAEGAEIDFQDAAAETAYAKKPDPTFLPYKVGLHFFSKDDGKKMQERFRRELPHLKIVVCEEIHHNSSLKPGEKRKKYCLDIMPATKADAANYLIKKLGLKQGVVAGDSGNDIDMLLETPHSFVAVAVGGHKAELQAALEEHKTAHRSPKPIFIDANDDRFAAQTLLLFSEYLAGKGRQNSIKMI